MSFVPHVTPPRYLLCAHFCLPAPSSVFTWKVNDGFLQINDEQGWGVDQVVSIDLQLLHQVLVSGVGTINSGVVEVFDVISMQEVVLQLVNHVPV